ncbi:MAG: S9 family peptidase [Gammaproteobacteria bacterium]
MKAKLASGLALFALLFAAQSPADTQANIKNFFKNAEFHGLKLSPNGKYLAAITRPEGVKAYNLVVLDLQNMKGQSLTTLTNRDVGRYFWANNDRLIFTEYNDLDNPEKNYYMGVYSTTRDGKHNSDLNPRDATGHVQESIEPLRFLSMLQDDPDYVLIAMPSTRKGFPDVGKLNIHNGSVLKVVSNPGYVRKWFVDSSGSVRAGVSTTENLESMRVRILYRENVDTDWRSLGEFDNDQIKVLGFARDDKHLLVAYRKHGDRFAVYTMDPATGKIGPALIANDTYDVDPAAYYNPNWCGEPLCKDRHEKPIYFTYSTDKTRKYFLDSKMEGVMKAVDQALPSTDNEIISMSDDGTTFLVFSHSDRVEGVYYLLDLPAGKLKFVLTVNNKVDPKKMAHMRPITYQSRDGLTIHGYLTLPPGKDSKKLPLIVNPHGGPYGIRDVWGFNPEVQLLASEGYAVLQPNYRGSGGYGYKFKEAGYQKWGLQMQDDITDAVKWAIDQGYADPKRIGIYGASYGGYATVEGLVKTPDLYKVGVDYVGVTDLLKLYDYDSRNDHVSGQYGLKAWWKMAIGDPSDPVDAKRLEATSPINHVKQIKAPLLVIAGVADPRVPIDQSRSLVRALSSEGKTYDYIEKRHEGHGFHAEKNRLEVYTAVVNWLHKYL